MKNLNEATSTEMENAFRKLPNAWNTPVLSESDFEDMCTILNSYDNNPKVNKNIVVVLDHALAAAIRVIGFENVTVLVPNLSESSEASEFFEYDIQAINTFKPKSNTMILGSHLTVRNLTTCGPKFERSIRNMNKKGLINEGFDVMGMLAS